MKNARRILERAIVESLEYRKLMSSVTFAQGVLTLNGNLNSPNTLSITLSDNGRTLTAIDNNDIKAFELAKINQIRIVGGNSADRIRVDPHLTMGVYIDAKGGHDFIQTGSGDDTIVGSAGSDSVDSNQPSDHGNGNGHKNSPLLDPSAPPPSDPAPPIYTVPLPPTDPDEPTDPELPTNPVLPVEPPIESPDDPTTPTPPEEPVPPQDPAPPQEPVTPTDPQDPVVEPPDTTDPTPTPTVDPLAPDVHITFMDNAEMVGAAVHVQGLDTLLQTGSVLDARYDWNFGDTSGQYNTLTGWNAAHIYDSPGTYTITLRVTDAAGHVGQMQGQVIIAADTRHVIYVNANGNDGNSGASADQAVKTFARAAQLVDNDTEVLFARGQSFDVNSPMVIADHNVLIGAYGSGNQPVLMWTGPRQVSQIINVSNISSDVTIQDLTLDSIYNQDTDQTNMVHGISPAGQNIAIRNSTFLNLGYAINANGGPHGLLVQDNNAPSVTGLRGYFTWFEGSDGVFLGNTVANVTREHVVRMRYYDRVLLADNNFTNLDRRGDGDAYDTNKGTIVEQVGQYVYATHNTLNDGGMGFGPLGAVGAAPASDRSNWSVMEYNTLNNTGLGVNHGGSHAMIRNNLIYLDNSPGVTIAGYNTTFDRGVADVYVVDNVQVNNGTKGKFLCVGAQVDGITVLGNRYYAVNESTGDGDHAAISVEDTNMNSFREIDGNVWVMKAAHYDAYFYVWQGAWSTDGLYSIEAWNALSMVGTDSVINTSVTPVSFDVNALGITVGAVLG